MAGFKKAVWENAVVGFLLCGLCAKFHQNPDGADFLKKTGEKKRYEASPWDTLCGVGQSVFNMVIWDESSHTGANLMEVPADCEV